MSMYIPNRMFPLEGSKAVNSTALSNCDEHQLGGS